MIKVSEKIMEIDIELNSASVARCQKCRTANVMKHLGNRGGAEPNKGNNGNNSNEDKAPTQAPTPAPTLAPTPACVDDYDLGTVAPPWSDFVSCAEEQDYCQDHQDTLMKHCKKTCGVCNNQDQADNEDKGNKHEKGNTGDSNRGPETLGKGREAAGEKGKTGGVHGEASNVGGWG